MSYDNYDSFKNSDEGRREGDGSSANRSGSGRPRFVKHTRPAYSGREEGRRPYGDNARPYGERRPYGGNSGEARPFNAENRFNKRPYGANSSYEGRRPYGARPAKEQYGEERRPYGERPYGERPYGERRPYGEGRPARSEQQGGGNRYEGGYKRPYGERANGERPCGGQRPQRNGYNPHAKYSQKKRLEYKEKNYDPNEPVRLNKFLANAGVCSRRDADKFITSGVVTVNGVVVTELGTKVLRSDNVQFHDQAIKMEKKVYILLNKPKGCVTTSEDPQNRKTVMDLVQGACPERIYPVGRLDRGTTGVLLLTNDGEMASKLTHPKYLKKKIYHVFTDHNVSVGDLQKIMEGIALEDGEVKADAVDYASPTDKKQVGIEIHSGKNRIVRRIFEHLGYQVTKLDRVYFAGLTKKNLRRGDWRFLTEKEVEMLHMGAYE